MIRIKMLLPNTRSKSIALVAVCVLLVDSSLLALAKRKMTVIKMSQDGAISSSKGHQLEDNLHETMTLLMSDTRDGNEIESQSQGCEQLLQGGSEMQFMPMEEHHSTIMIEEHPIVTHLETEKDERILPENVCNMAYDMVSHGTLFSNMAMQHNDGSQQKHTPVISKALEKLRQDSNGNSLQEKRKQLIDKFPMKLSKLNAAGKSTDSVDPSLGVQTAKQTNSIWTGYIAPINENQPIMNVFRASANLMDQMEQQKLYQTDQPREIHVEAPKLVGMRQIQGAATRTT